MAVPAQSINIDSFCYLVTNVTCFDVPMTDIAWPTYTKLYGASSVILDD
jgi:hypothetical protein